MTSKTKKPRQKLNVVVDAGESGQHKVCYSLDGRFCAVYPSVDQWKVVLSTTVSRKIAEAVKLQQNLEREPVVLFQRTIEDIEPVLSIPGQLE